MDPPHNRAEGVLSGRRVGATVLTARQQYDQAAMECEAAEAALKVQQRISSHPSAAESIRDAALVAAMQRLDLAQEALIAATTNGGMKRIGPPKRDPAERRSAAADTGRGRRLLRC